MEENNSENNVANPTPSLDKNDTQKKMHMHLSTAFIIVGIVSFSLGAYVNWLTIKKFNGWS